MLKLAIPLVHVSNSAVAEEFYCKRLGFRMEFAHRADEMKADPCYIGVTRDGIRLHISSFSGDGVAGNVVNLLVDDVDTLHAEFLRAGVQIDSGPVDQTWGTREMYVKDVDGNSMRFIADPNASKSSQTR